MQASPAKNETRLPRAVLKRSAAIEERIKARSEPETPDPALPTPVSSADPANPNPAAPTPPAPPADPRHSDPAYWKQRFDATAGRLRVREDEHRAELTGLRGRITELEDEVRTLKTAIPSTPAAEIDLGEFFSPEQIKDIGEEDAHAIAQAALAAATKQARTVVEQEIKPLRDQRQADAAEQLRLRKESFTEALESRIPNMAEIDADPSWLTWLMEEDPETGIQRQEILTKHVTALRADKVAGIVEKWLKSKEPPAPPVAPVASGAAPGAEPPPQPNAADLRPPTQAEVKDFYKRAALGKVTDKERTTFEARLKLRAGR